MRWLLVGLLVLAACGHRYFKVPRTSDAHECLGRCTELHVGCRVEQGGHSCQRQFERCLSLCPGTVEVEYDEWLAWTSADAGAAYTTP